MSTTKALCQWYIFVNVMLHLSITLKNLFENMIRIHAKKNARKLDYEKAYVYFECRIIRSSEIYHNNYDDNIINKIS
jgi:hypothetical protein